MIPANQNQNPNAQIINRFPSNSNINPFIPLQQQSNINKGIAFKKINKIQQPLVNQSKTPIKQGRYGIKSQNGQFILNNNINPNQINQIQKNPMLVSQQVKQIPATSPLDIKRLNSANVLNNFQNNLIRENASPRKMAPMKMNVINGQVQKIPLENIRGNRLANQVALRTIPNGINNNNAQILLRARNGISPITQRVGARPQMMVLNNNNRILVPVNPY